MAGEGGLMALCCGQTTAGTEGTRAATAHARLHAGKVLPSSDLTPTPAPSSLHSNHDSRRLHSRRRICRWPRALSTWKLFRGVSNVNRFHISQSIVYYVAYFVYHKCCTRYIVLNKLLYKIKLFQKLFTIDI